MFRGNAEETIRKEIISRGYIKGIIGLPANLFYGTGIPACLVILDKEHAQSRRGIFIIDAGKGFVKDGNKNRLREQDIHKIVDVFNNQTEIDGFSRMVAVDEIIGDKNQSNLNLPRYIDNSDAEDIHDLTAHLNGGIPKHDIDQLKSWWDVLPSIKSDLFDNPDADYLSLKISNDEVGNIIENSDEYKHYVDDVMSKLEQWKSKHETSLKSLGQSCNPKELITQISEDLLATFGGTKLIDNYDIYQHLMEYWAETMNDDVYAIASDDWYDASQLTMINKGEKDSPDITIGTGKNAQKFKSDLIPPVLIVNKYYQSEQAEIDKLQSELDNVESDIESLVDENAGDDDLLEDAKNDKGELNKTNLNKRIKEIKGNDTFADEMGELNKALALMDKKAKTGKLIKSQQNDLNELVIAKYGNLSVDEIKQLVVHDKWFAYITDTINADIENVAKQLSGRILEIDQRYSNTLPKLTKSVNDYSDAVESHLKNMGLSW